jgi:eukaryotic-like serine/threonine-protein kinase
VFFDDEGRAVLTDWALGNMPGVSNLEYTDAVLYQPPDQLREPEGYLREKGYRRDVFAFAVLSFRLLTGAFPRCTKTFDQVAPEPGKTRREGIAANLKQVAKAVEGQPLVEWPDAAANPLEKAYREILDTCLSLDPAARPATAGEVLRRFEAAEQSAVAEKQRDAVLDQQRAARRSAWRANVAAGVLAGAVMILSALWRVSSRELENEEAGRRADLKRLEAAHEVTDAARLQAEQTLESERKGLQYEKDLWLARLEESRATGDRLFAWAMEKGHRKLPPLDGRDQRLKRLELYFQDFITRTAEIGALKEERARARLQLAEVSLAKGDPTSAAQRLKEALDHAGDLPAGPDLDLRLATDRLLLGPAFPGKERSRDGAGFRRRAESAFRSSSGRGRCGSSATIAGDPGFPRVPAAGGCGEGLRGPGSIVEGDPDTQPPGRPAAGCGAVALGTGVLLLLFGDDPRRDRADGGCPRGAGSGRGGAVAPAPGGSRQPRPEARSCRVLRGDGRGGDPVRRRGVGRVDLQVRGEAAGGIDATAAG